VTSDTVLTTVDRNEALEAYVQVPLERAREARVGLPIQILDAGGTRLADARITFVSPTVDNQTQSVLVKGTVSNPHGALRAAQYVRARIVWSTTSGIVIPVTAVLRVSGQFFAFVAEDAGGRLVARQRARSTPKPPSPSPKTPSAAPGWSC
jgi:multidrug efflux pump subunit AcrA (membrane-fusion protein)